MKQMTISVLERCPVHTPVRTPMYRLTLNQSDRRILCVFQSVYHSKKYSKCHTFNTLRDICHNDVLKLFTHG